MSGRAIYKWKEFHVALNIAPIIIMECTRNSSPGLLRMQKT